MANTRQGSSIVPALAVAAFTLSSATVAAAPPAITLGQIAPFTGSGAEFGQFYRDGAALAVQHLNAAAEETLGGPIIAAHIAEDSATSPTPAVEAALSLIQVHGVPAIIGGWSSGVTVAVATSATIPAGVLQVSNGSTSPLISILPEDRDADMLFRTTASDALQGVVAAQLARGELVDGYRFDTVSTIYVNNPYGQGLSNAFSRSFQLRGGTVHAQIPHPEETQPTYTAQLASAYKDRPDMLFAASYPGHSAIYLQEARDVFKHTTWQLVDGNLADEVVAAVGADTIDKVYGTTPGQDPNRAEFKAFAEQFKAEFGHDRVPPFTESAYDAAMVIGLALVKAYADGHEKVGDITGTVLRDRLRDVANAPGKTIAAGDLDSIKAGMQAIMNGEDVQYSGAAGPVEFDESGDVLTPIAIVQYQDGVAVTIDIRSPEDIPAE